MPWVFEYAELLPQDIVKVLGHAPFCALPASLEKYQVVFKGQSRKWGGAVATLERKKESLVYGSALLVSAAELDKLDKAHNMCKKIPVKVRLVTDDVVEASAYVLLDDNAEVAEPSKDYLKTLSKHLSFYWAGIGTKLKLEDLFKLNKPETVAVKPQKTAVETTTEETLSEQNETSKKKKKG